MRQNYTQEYLHDLKTKLKIKYPQLTEKDLHHKEGLEEKMFRMVEYKLGMTKREMKKIIAAL